MPSWAVWKEDAEDKIVEMYRPGHWYRNTGKYCDKFEAVYAKLIGAKYCLVTATGTTVLVSCIRS